MLISEKITSGQVSHDDFSSEREKKVYLVEIFLVGAVELHEQVFAHANLQKQSAAEQFTGRPVFALIRQYRVHLGRPNSRLKLPIQF